MSVSQPARIATIIVNYNAATLIIDNIGAILTEHAAFPGSKIYIVDNASPGGDAQTLAAFVDKNRLNGVITLMPQTGNGGFAKGNNAALREILPGPDAPDYIFLLNPDAFPRPGSLRTLIDFIDATPRAGLAGPRLEGADGAAQISAFRFFTALGEFVNMSQLGLLFKLFSNRIIAPPQKDTTFKTDWICGAAVLIRRELFDDIGLFDEEYFLYYEETDFMLNANRAGWETWYVHDASAVHLVGQSSGVIDGMTRERVSPPYWFHSRKQYFRKNHGPLYAAAADAGWVAGSLINAAKKALTGRDATGVLANIRQFFKAGDGK